MQVITTGALLEPSEVQTVTTTAKRTDEVQVVRTVADDVDEVQVIETCADVGQQLGGLFTLLAFEHANHSANDGVR